jgi:hypothetical protein
MAILHPCHSMKQNPGSEKSWFSTQNYISPSDVIDDDGIVSFFNNFSFNCPFLVCIEPRKEPI